MKNQEYLINVKDRKTLIDLIEFIKIDTSMLEASNWDLLEQEIPNIEINKEELLEKFEEKEGALYFEVFLINKAIEEKINEENIKFLIKNLGSRYVSTEEDRIRCLNSNVEPYFNAIKAAVLVYKKSGIKITFEYLCLAKEVIGFSLREILLQKEKTREIAEKLNKLEMLESFNKNCEITKRAIFEVLKDIPALKTDNLSIPNIDISSLEINYQKIYQKIDANTERIINEIKSALNEINFAKHSSLETEPFADKESVDTNDVNIVSTPQIDEAFLIQSIKDALLENKNELLENIENLLSEKEIYLQKLIQELNDTNEQLKEALNMFSSKTEYIDDTNAKLSDTNALLKEIEKKVNEFYERYQKDIEEARKLYENHNS